MDIKQRFWQKVPPKVRNFFEDEAETIIVSRLPPEQLVYCIRESLNTIVSLNLGSARGSVIGSTLRIRWGSVVVSDSFEPLFRGRIEEAEGGSRIVGCMSHNRFVQVFMAVWCGFILVFSVLMVWTIIFPLAGWGLLWLVNGIMGIGDYFCHGRREHILEHLHACAARTL